MFGVFDKKDDGGIVKDRLEECKYRSRRAIATVQAMFIFISVVLF